MENIITPVEVISSSSTAPTPEPGSYRITVPPPLPSARQQQLAKLKLAKTTFEDIKDLQLAAELGRTVLERNEELETELKEQQVVMDDQAQEIEFLTKQVSSMKEESANRSKIYEQLESSICELEKTNTQLGRKHEVDKKRIQSLCENIEYLERKCEELNVTLQSLKNDQGVGGTKNGSGKHHRIIHRISGYFSFGSSDSASEEENNAMSSSSGGFNGLFRKRSHSLQDLRDYTPSPDEFDSGNSNSPDLKTSESEFIDSLENRIEELINSRNNGNEKVRQLEAQIKILVQENANLHQQILQLSHEKEEEVSELRKYLQDSSHPSGSLLNLNSSFFPYPLTSSTRRNSETNSTPGRERDRDLDSSTDPFHETSQIGQIQPHEPNSSLPKNLHQSTNFALSSLNRSANSAANSSGSICRRCAAEIQILNLVNSIENDGNLYDWEFGAGDEDMEFSSLEHELAKATGTPYNNHRGGDNRYTNDENMNVNPFGGFGSEVAKNQQCFAKDERDDDDSTPVTGGCARKLGNSRHIDVDELDFGSSSTEIFNIFFGDKNGNGEKIGTDSPKPKVRFSDVGGDGAESSSGSGPLSSEDGSCDEEEDDEDRMEMEDEEDPCLIKDRKPEFCKNKSKKSSKSKRTRKGGVESATPTASNAIEDSSSVKKNPKFLQLPKRIHSESECEVEDSISGEGIICQNLQNSQNEEEDEVINLDLTKDQGSQNQEMILEESSSSMLLCQTIFENSDYGNISDCSEATESDQLDVSISSSTSVISLPELLLSSSSTTMDASISTSSSNCPKPSPPLPEYKQILSSLFSIFNNSKRKYPIPMYPFIQEARRHGGANTGANGGASGAGGLIHRHSHSQTYHPC